MRTSNGLIALTACLLSLPAAAQTAPVHAELGQAAVAASPASGPGSYSGGNAYVLDDGSADFFVGCPINADFALLHRYHAQGVTDVVRSIQVSYVNTSGHSTGWVCVWEDPNDDGDPHDAVLLVAQPVTLQTSGVNQFISYSIPPVVVHRQFFVGVVVSIASFTFNLFEDGDSGQTADAWYCWSSHMGNFNFQNLAANLQPPLDNTLTGGVWMLRAEGGILAPTTYCVGKVNSLGCVPTMRSVGASSSSAGSGFLVEAQRTRNNKSGLLTYSLDGRNATPFQGGTLCVDSPVQRTPPVDSGGSAAPAHDCSGLHSIDMNTFASGALGGAPPVALSMPGTTVDCQWWGRDPGEPSGFGSSLSDALEYVVGF